MTQMCTIHMKIILEIYKGYEGISTLVDVGGGNGQSLKMIISKYPSIKAINFDLPQVIEHAPSSPGNCLIPSQILYLVTTFPRLFGLKDFPYGYEIMKYCQILFRD